MIQRWLLPLAAIVGFGFAVYLAAQATKPVVGQAQLSAPAKNPYAKAVAGAGIVEPASENISVAPAIGGLVTDVFVTWGQHVKAGERLLQIDSRPLQAQVAIEQAAIAGKQAAVAQAEASLAKLKQGHRPEDEPIYRARLANASAAARDADDQWERMKALANSNARSDDDVNRRKYAALEAHAQEAEAKGNLDELIAGSWDKDIAIAQAAVVAAEQDVASAKAQLDATNIDLARLTVTAPVDGTVLRINIRKGEYATAAGVADATSAAIVIGDIDHLNVRVDIDESDVPRFVLGSSGMAYVRGDTDNALKLTFVRVDPFVIPKRNLTGSNIERVDTRVLQAIYAIDAGQKRLYVGQQMDVYIDTKTPS
jgi:HlyD family secretion protein